jgi:ornithine cyclodeaminase
MRTGSASGVATRWLATEGADELAIIGTGKQAITQIAAVIAVRPIKRIRVFGRHEERRAQCVTRVREEFGIEVVAAQSVAEAVKDAPIITVVTRATEPVLSGDMVARGAHINAVGAIVPSRAEIASDVLARCGQIVVDSVPQAQKLSRELIDYFGSGRASWDQVQSLAGVVAAERSRAAADDLTLFKSLGMGLSDLSLGIELYHKALRLGVGHRFAQPQRAAVTLR